MELVRIIGDTLAFVSDYEDIASPNTCTRFAFILFKMQQSLHLQKCNNRLRLSPAAQAEVTSIMTEHSHQFARCHYSKFSKKSDLVVQWLLCDTLVTLYTTR
jgi:hypothetical protein